MVGSSKVGENGGGEGLGYRRRILVVIGGVHGENAVQGEVSAGAGRERELLLRKAEGEYI
jgi:hypothetical protein